MKKLIVSATLIAVALGSGAILAAQGEHNQGRMHNPGVTAESTAPGERGQHAQNAHGHGHMAQMHARMGEHMAQHGGHEQGSGAGHAGPGNTGENCPMHGQRNPS